MHNMTQSIHCLQLINNRMIKSKWRGCAWQLEWSSGALGPVAIALLLCMVTCVGCTLNFTQQPGASIFDTSRCPQLANDNLEECLFHAFSLFNQRGNAGIPINRQQLQHMCSVFQQGFECLDLLAQSCLDSDELRVYLSNVTRVRDVVAGMCKDSAFQNEYLKHSDCYEELSKDWDSCSDPLLTHLNQDLNKQVTTNSQLIDICSINQDFLDCITRAAYQRCDDSAAAFISELAVSLSGSMDQCPESPQQHTAKESTASKHWAHKQPSRANTLYTAGLYLTILSTTINHLLTS